jgi:uncharacterized membrane protein
MTLESSKLLGGIGAILMFVGILPVINYVGIIEIIGAIMVLIALHGLSNLYQDKAIFSNALYGVIIAIVGAVVAFALLITVVLANITPLLTQIYPGWDGNWASLQGMTPDPNAIAAGNFDLSNLGPLLIGLGAIALIVWIVAIIATFFVRRSLKSTTAKTNVGLFGTAGLLMLIGAFLAIIFIGFILIWIGALLLAIAFFQVKPAEPIAAPAEAYPPPPATTV